LAAAAGFLLALGAQGCGGAHAPCPVSPAAIDGRREEVEKLDARVGEARAAERVERQRREAAARRVAAARAASDSAAAAGRAR